MEDAKEKEGSQFNYRVAFRTSEVMGLLAIVTGLKSKSPLMLLLEFVLDRVLNFFFLMLMIATFRIIKKGIAVFCSK